MTNSWDSSSLTTAAVKPAAVLALPLVYTALGLNSSTCLQHQHQHLLWTIHLTYVVMSLLSYTADDDIYWWRRGPLMDLWTVARTANCSRIWARHMPVVAWSSDNCPAACNVNITVMCMYCTIFSTMHVLCFSCCSCFVFVHCSCVCCLLHNYCCLYTSSVVSMIVISKSAVDAVILSSHEWHLKLLDFLHFQNICSQWSCLWYMQNLCQLTSQLCLHMHWCVCLWWQKGHLASRKIPFSYRTSG